MPVQLINAELLSRMLEFFSSLKVFHIIDQVQGFLIIPYSRNHYHVTRLRTTFLRIPLFTTHFVCSRVAPIVPIVSLPLVSPYTSLFGRQTGQYIPIMAQLTHLQLLLHGLWYRSK